MAPDYHLVYTRSCGTTCSRLRCATARPYLQCSKHPACQGCLSCHCMLFPPQGGHLQLNKLHTFAWNVTKSVMSALRPKVHRAVSALALPLHAVDIRRRPMTRILNILQCNFKLCRPATSKLRDNSTPAHPHKLQGAENVLLITCSNVYR